MSRVLNIDIQFTIWFISVDGVLGGMPSWGRAPPVMAPAEKCVLAARSIELLRRRGHWSLGRCRSI